MSWVLPLFVLIPVLGALLVITARHDSQKVINWLAALTTGVTMVLATALYYVRAFNQLIVFDAGSLLIMDGFSHLLVLLANVIAFLLVIYSAQYFKNDQRLGRFYLLFLIMLAGINGVALAGNLMLMYIFIEMAALSAYALVAFGHDRQSLEASFKYFILGEVASLFILAAIGMVFSATGTTDLFALAPKMELMSNQVRQLVVVLFIAGLGMKAALVPFHFWLPDAHTTAPAPISAILSGIIIKVLGIYALARIIINVIGLTPDVALILLVLGGLTILVGGFLAIVQWDMKRLMAYSSISQVGYIVVGLSLGSPLGIMGAVFHLANHALMKPLLFLTAGAVEKEAGSRDLRELGGLRKKMPLTFLGSLFGSLAISGVPPFNGFWSKVFIIFACVQVGQNWLALIGVIGGVLTMAAFLKIQQYVFFGPVKNESVKEAPVAICFPIIVLALACLIIGITFPLFIDKFINPAVVALANRTGFGRMIMGGL